VDVCAAHGTFFDTGELDTVRTWFEKKAAADGAESARFREAIAQNRTADTTSELPENGWLLRWLSKL
jgi:hypothetical protein